MEAWKMTLVSKVAIFHFHDYGWKGTSTYEAQTRRSNEFGGTWAHWCQGLPLFFNDATEFCYLIFH